MEIDLGQSTSDLEVLGAPIHSIREFLFEILRRLGGLEPKVRLEVGMVVGIVDEDLVGLDKFSSVELHPVPPDDDVFVMVASHRLKLGLSAVANCVERGLYVGVFGGQVSNDEYGVCLWIVVQVFEQLPI
jgi:hypothetical protein